MLAFSQLEPKGVSRRTFEEGGMTPTRKGDRECVHAVLAATAIADDILKDLGWEGGWMGQGLLCLGCAGRKGSVWGHISREGMNADAHLVITHYGAG